MPSRSEPAIGASCERTAGRRGCGRDTCGCPSGAGGRRNRVPPSLPGFATETSTEAETRAAGSSPSSSSPASRCGEPARLRNASTSACSAIARRSVSSVSPPIAYVSEPSGPQLSSNRKPRPNGSRPYRHVGAPHASGIARALFAGRASVRANMGAIRTHRRIQSSGSRLHTGAIAPPKIAYSGWLSAAARKPDEPIVVRQAVIVAEDCEISIQLAQSGIERSVLPFPRLGDDHQRQSPREGPRDLCRAVVDPVVDHNQLPAALGRNPLPCTNSALAPAWPPCHRWR